jgi:hypothetical protein
MSERMTIAQALRRVKKLKGLIAEHSTRVKQGVSYVSTEIPAFRFEDEMKALVSTTEEMVVIESQIAVANATTMIADGSTQISLARAIRVLQELKGTITLYQGLNLKSGVEKVRTNDWDDTLEKCVNRVQETVRVTDLSEQDRDKIIKFMKDRFEALNNSVEDANHAYFVG